MPAIEFGQLYNNGVKYLKINKFDANGIDKSDYLAQMASIRINHDDIGTKEYVISTAQVQNDYFIFGLTFPQTITSSIGDINDYSFQATTTTLDICNTYQYSASNFTINNGNTLGYLTASSGLYGLGNTPNTPIKFSFTSSISSPDGNVLYFGLFYDNGDSEGLIPSIISTPTTLTIGGPANIISGSIIFSSSLNIPFIEGTTNLFFGFYNPFGPFTPLAVNYFNITASNIIPSFNGSSSLIIFDPDSINFDYNDYNPLLGNAEIPQYSTTWMDVDYSQNPVIPINFSLIISGTADRAFVQDSNYSSKAWSNIRYNGSRTTSYRIN
jgi:hypothetical protein